MDSIKKLGILMEFHGISWGIHGDLMGIHGDFSWELFVHGHLIR
jgi:hypothetical protein